MKNDKNQPKVEKYDILNNEDSEKCPICGNKVFVESKCAFCIECGWSMCSN